MNDLTAPIELSTAVAIFAASVSFIAAIVSIYASWRSRKISENSVQLEGFNARQDFRKQLFDWANRAMDEISLAQTILRYSEEGETEQEVRLKELLARLTSTIDVGRWLLPNKDHEKYGTNKEGAYAGLRQDALDELVGIYRCIEFSLKIPFSERSAKSEKIELSKRRFATAIQDRLEPRLVTEELSDILNRIGK